MEVLTLAVADAVFALEASRVVEVAPRVLVTGLPDAPPFVLGAINHRGDIIVAIDVRARFGLPEARPLLSDHFVIFQSAARRFALVVDRTIDRVTIDDRERRPPPLALRGVDGIFCTDGDVVVLFDVDAVLSPSDGARVDAALAT
jgi:purine-binding chemotaxis protein CheW